MSVNEDTTKTIAERMFSYVTPSYHGIFLTHASEDGAFVCKSEKLGFPSLSLYRRSTKGKKGSEESPIYTGIWISVLSPPPPPSEKGTPIVKN